VASITTLPARLDGLQWILVGGFAVLFALGLIFLWRQPVAPVAAAASASVASVAPPVAVGQMPVPLRQNEAHAQSASQSSAAAAANIDQQVRGSLDELKDVLFRLELRREAGTVTPEDYTRERDRVQKVLRDLVKG